MGEEGREAKGRGGEERRGGRNGGERREGEQDGVIVGTMWNIGSMYLSWESARTIHTLLHDERGQSFVI